MSNTHILQEERFILTHGCQRIQSMVVPQGSHSWQRLGRGLCSTLAARGRESGEEEPGRPYSSQAHLQTHEPFWGTLGQTVVVSVLIKLNAQRPLHGQMSSWVLGLHD